MYIKRIYAQQFPTQRSSRSEIRLTKAPDEILYQASRPKSKETHRPCPTGPYDVPVLAHCGAM